MNVRDVATLQWVEPQPFLVSLSFYGTCNKGAVHHSPRKVNILFSWPWPFLVFWVYISQKIDCCIKILDYIDWFVLVSWPAEILTCRHLENQDNTNQHFVLFLQELETQAHAGTRQVTRMGVDVSSLGRRKQPDGACVALFAALSVWRAICSYARRAQHSLGWFSHPWYSWSNTFTHIRSSKHCRENIISPIFRCRSWVSERLKSLPDVVVRVSGRNNMQTQPKPWWDAWETKTAV